jgi:DNA-binding transcriptional MocR family regulator
VPFSRRIHQVTHGTIGLGELDERLGAWNAGGGPLAVALTERIGELISTGALPPGTQLPAERRLAARLGVSRGTVIVAFKRLRADRLIVTRHGSGSRVTQTGSPVSGPREAHLTASLPDESIIRGLLPDDQVAIELRAADWHGTEDLPEEAFSFDARGSMPDLDGHGYEVLGIGRLRAAVADHLTAAGLRTTPEQILITSGAQQAITLITQLIVGPRDAVAFEELTYPGAIDAALASRLGWSAGESHVVV